MKQQDITSIIRNVPVLGPEDSVRRAAGLIRASDGSGLFVISGGQVYGMITEQAITAYLAAAQDPEAALNDPIAGLVSGPAAYISPGATLQQAAEIFGATTLDILPVVGEYGTFRGAIYRGDVVGLLSRNLRPPTVAGMATPLGVYLTTGSHTGGAGNLGLFLTGATLGLIITSSALLAGGAMWLFGKVTGIPIMAYLRSFPLTMIPNLHDLPLYIYTVLSVLFMFTLLRLSPLSGYHAAEHMTVHAIEAGEAITPEVVRNMPRVHPRCGTNLMAAAGVFMLIVLNFNGGIAVILALVIVLLGWRSVGGWLQYFATTKNPSEKQLANGVAAGQQLLERYHENPHCQLVGFQRIWRIGLLQTAAGLATMWHIIMWVLARLNVTLPFNI